MNLRHLIAATVLGLVVSTDAFAGKEDREKKGLAPRRNLKMASSAELLDSLSAIFETTDHHGTIVMGQVPPASEIDLERHKNYGDKKPQKVDPAVAEKAMRSIARILKQDSRLFFDVVSEEDIWLSSYYASHLSGYERQFALPLTRAVWKALSDENLKKLMVYAYGNRFISATLTEPALKQDLIHNTPYLK